MPLPLVRLVISPLLVREPDFRVSVVIEPPSAMVLEPAFWVKVVILPPMVWSPPL